MGELRIRLGQGSRAGPCCSTMLSSAPWGTRFRPRRSHLYFPSFASEDTSPLAFAHVQNTGGLSLPGPGGDTQLKEALSPACTPPPAHKHTSTPGSTLRACLARGGREAEGAALAGLRAADDRLQLGLRPCRDSPPAPQVSAGTEQPALSLRTAGGGTRRAQAQCTDGASPQAPAPQQTADRSKQAVQLQATGRGRQAYTLQALSAPAPRWRQGQSERRCPAREATERRGVDPSVTNHSAAVHLAGMPRAISHT